MKRGIKVLHVGLSDNSGGIETVVQSWYRYLPDDISFDFVNVSAGRLAYEDEFLSKGAKIYKIPSRKENARLSYAALEKIMIKGDYNYLHFHAMSLSWPEPIIIAGKNNRTKGIIHSHMVVDKNMSLKYRILHTIGRMRLSKVNYLRLACGKQAGQSMFGGENFNIIANGVELNRFVYSEKKRERIRNKLGICEDEWLIGHVGRPGPQKNYSLIFQTFYELLHEKSNKKLRLLLIGDLKEDEEIKYLGEKYKVSDQLILTGSVADTSGYYSAMDCFYFPSLYEGFSVSLVEAQATGLPCVVSRNVSSESKLISNFSFVDINDTNESKRELNRYLNMGLDRGRQSDKIPYDIRETSKAIFEFYRNNLNI